jgi:hypothetical protein
MVHLYGQGLFAPGRGVVSGRSQPLFPLPFVLRIKVRQPVGRHEEAGAAQGAEDPPAIRWQRLADSAVPAATPLYALEQI